jgi:hypothetical protein
MVAEAVDANTEEVGGEWPVTEKHPTVAHKARRQLGRQGTHDTATAGHGEDSISSDLKGGDTRTLLWRSSLPAMCLPQTTTDLVNDGKNTERVATQSIMTARATAPAPDQHLRVKRLRDLECQR